MSSAANVTNGSRLPPHWRGDPFFGGTDPILSASLQRLTELAVNTYSSRAALFDRLTTGSDPRRSIEDECGYPRDVRQLAPEDYQRFYDRDPIAARVVEVYPKECWQTQPEIYEDSDPEISTPFEEAWDTLSHSLRGEQSWLRDPSCNPVWDYLLRADILSGIGRYGVILLGIDDGLPLGTPAAGSVAANSDPRREMPAFNPAGFHQSFKDAEGKLLTNKLPTPTELLGTEAQYYDWASREDLSQVKPRKEGTKLLFLRVFSEAQARIIQYESNISSPRFGKPVRYAITLNDPRDQSGGTGLNLSTVYVHWSRVVHVADGLQSSETSGTPRMMQVYEQLLNLRKLYGASPEGYWKACIAAISLETHPQLGGDVIIDDEDLKDQIEQFQNGLQRFLTTTGMSAKVLTPSVVDPGVHIDKQIEAICIRLGIPKRVFLGSERGELASSQDDAAWNDRLRQRQRGHITSRIIGPFVDALIMLGVLPIPDEENGYKVFWPDLTSQTAQERATVANTLVTALAAYVGGGVDAIIRPIDLLTKIVGMPDEEAQQVLDRAEEAALEREEEQAAAQAEQQAAGFPPEGGAPGEELPVGPPGQPPGNGPGQPPRPPQNASEGAAGAKEGGTQS